MALIKCPKCGEEISDQAEVCVSRKRAAEIAKKRATKAGLTGFAGKNWGSER